MSGTALVFIFTDILLRPVNDGREAWSGDVSARRVETNAVNGVLAALQESRVNEGGEDCILAPCCPFREFQSSIIASKRAGVNSGIPPALACTAHGVNVPICEGNHFQTALLESAQTRVYIFDSLGPAGLPAVRDAMSPFTEDGWVVDDGGFHLQRGDAQGAWSCGLCTIYVAVVFTEHCQQVREGAGGIVCRGSASPVAGQWGGGICCGRSVCKQHEPALLCCAGVVDD